MEGGTGHAESGVIHLTVSTQERVAEKGGIHIPGALGRQLDSQTLIL